MNGWSGSVRTRIALRLFQSFSWCYIKVNQVTAALRPRSMKGFSNFLKAWSIKHSLRDRNTILSFSCSCHASIPSNRRKEDSRGCPFASLSSCQRFRSTMMASPPSASIILGQLLHFRSLNPERVTPSTAFQVSATIFARSLGDQNSSWKRASRA